MELDQQYLSDLSCPHFQISYRSNWTGATLVSCSTSGQGRSSSRSRRRRLWTMGNGIDSTFSGTRKTWGSSSIFASLPKFPSWKTELRLSLTILPARPTGRYRRSMNTWTSTRRCKLVEGWFQRLLSIEKCQVIQFIFKKFLNSESLCDYISHLLFSDRYVEDFDPTHYHWQSMPYGKGFDGCIRNIFHNSKVPQASSRSLFLKIRL